MRGWSRCRQPPAHGL